MTNRELLELAVLAVGYSFHWGEKHSVGDCKHCGADMAD